MMPTYASQKRLEEIISNAETFLLVASRADLAVTKYLQETIKEILRDLLEEKKYKLSGGLTGLGIKVGLDIIDAAIKIKTKQVDKVNLPNLTKFNENVTKLEQRFEKAQSKISSMQPKSLFTILEYLHKSGFEAALDYINAAEQ